MIETSQCWQTRNWRATESPMLEWDCTDWLQIIALMNSLYVKSPITQRNSPARLGTVEGGGGQRQILSPDSTSKIIKSIVPFCLFEIAILIMKTNSYLKTFSSLKVRVKPLIAPPSLSKHHRFICSWCSKLCPFGGNQSAAEERQRDSLSWLMRTMTELTIGASHLKCAQSQHYPSELNVCTVQTNAEKKGVSFIVAILLAANKFAPKCLPLHHLVHYSGRCMPWESYTQKNKRQEKERHATAWNAAVKWTRGNWILAMFRQLIQPNGCLKEVYSVKCVHDGGCTAENST